VKLSQKVNRNQINFFICHRYKQTCSTIEGLIFNFVIICSLVARPPARACENGELTVAKLQKSFCRPVQGSALTHVTTYWNVDNTRTEYSIAVRAFSSVCSVVIWKRDILFS
jgi:hypothetical protein